ncbi:MAG: TIR domain-containing protein [Thalassospira sp.]|uniref:TIR domain-containing protein n=1 Tax=Thalassospira sp. TaxID=1912094 RepID=UPI0032ED5B92
MAKRVFFSFHYQDVADFRANVVRNHWMTKPNRGEAGFFDASVWEEAKKDSNLAIKRLINVGLTNTSCTCVLIGSHTYARQWVHYEMFKSIAKGNYLFGVHINEIRGRDQQTKALGVNPFEYTALGFSEDGRSMTPYVAGKNGWSVFAELDRWNRSTPVPAGLHGRIMPLSQMNFPTYRWIADGGYTHFSKWAGE